MEDKIKKLLEPSLKDLNIVIDSITFERENNNLFLRICLDSNATIDLDRVVLATNIINPIMDKCDLIDEHYILEVYGKSKGEVNEKN